MNRYKITATDIMEFEDELDEMDALDMFCHSICHNLSGKVIFELLEEVKK